ncbi:hypothetical protein [Streptomyces diastatochromogenes]|uniref:Uncharacterized protein n=1 Tax=Streptomyces diastatochromogenes TaxID=42236 RepID=A0A233S793_STRDA|nr:hypothetical protein [Streptomyces diastatochromogenes]OXY91548.1 hypothetical protein BEK98_30230 [Streptomyces diastatochromogenes]
MGGTSEQQNAVTLLWQEHLVAPFPPRLRTADPAGVDVVLLDAGIAGCVSVWRKNGGRLDAGRQRTLLHCARELERALPLVTDAEELRYLLRLRRLAELTAAH